MQKPVLYVLIGIPGSGKSSWAEASECSTIDPDKFFGNKKERWKAFRATLCSLSEDGGDLVADATHLKRQWRYITAKQVSEEYKKVAVVFHTDFELCCKRRVDRFERWQMEEMRDSMEAVESREKFDALIHVYHTSERELSLIKL